MANVNEEEILEDEVLPTTNLRWTFPCMTVSDTRTNTSLGLCERRGQFDIFYAPGEKFGVQQVEGPFDFLLEPTAYETFFKNVECKYRTHCNKF